MGKEDESLITIECSQPGGAYTLFSSSPRLKVHLAGPAESGGTGPCICGFDRHARDENGRHLVGFSVGGGMTGPRVNHEVCSDCARLAGDSAIRGTHADLFAKHAADLLSSQNHAALKSQSDFYRKHPRTDDTGRDE
ncbi:hypothetical protein [Cryobacterium sp. GrIS_2_6]|uniref:hypothetical protein n=1 Tax=Cryobacterium sp. GrIS_2_6 TaxID=3162785 RepID=UPI002E0A71E0|nr:hypothetical protein [Cryobacterium psychrotolerans]MEC5149260.1 hypothetical protein [Cryobacterium psychrotolerans]MEC5149339.1 hypothetical protein [Cryobacterium psychrotolerans]